MDMAGSLTSGVWKPQGPPPPAPDDPGGGSGGGRGASRRATFTGLFVAMASIVMFFAAFTSALVVRRGLSNDWLPTPLPGILWLNTALLLASSAALEMGRRALRAGAREAFNRYWTGGTLLGALFLGGQYLAWQQLLGAGIYISTNPSSSFFYLLTAVHALHIAGGMAALLYVNVQALRLRLGPSKRTAVDVTAVYWHFVDVLWIYLLLLFLIWG